MPKLITSFSRLALSPAGFTIKMQDDVIICKQIEASTFQKVIQPTGYPSIIKGILKTNVRAPNPSVIMGQLNLDSSGSVHGMGSGVTAEAIMPNGSLARGKVVCLDVELGTGASSTWGSAGPVALQRYAIWGGGAAYANLNAYLWELDGITEGTGRIFSTGAGDKACSSTLKINIIGVGEKFIMLADTENT